MVKFDFPFALLHVSTVLVLLLFMFIMRMKNKAQIHFALLSAMGLMLIWSIGQILGGYAAILYGLTVMPFVYLHYFGTCFIPVSLLFIGIIFVHTKLKFSWKYLLLFIPPVVSYVLVITSQYHTFFFVKFSYINNETIYGSYFKFHTMFSYIYLLAGLYFLLYFSVKNSGFFSRQSILIFIGSVIPFIINILFILNIVVLPIYSTPIAFSFSIICFAFAILKFQFLNIVPVALQNVVDQISDSYMIINKELEVIDYNKTFMDTFSRVFLVKRKEKLARILKPEGSLNNVDTDNLIETLEKAVSEKRTHSFETQIIAGSFDRYFTIEITPIIKNDNHLGTIILLKDITQHIKDMDLIKQTQSQLMQRDRLASLGELAGGVAHDINSPLSAIQGSLYIITTITQMGQDLDDIDKLKKALLDIQENAKNATSTSGRIAKIINSVRDHTRNLTGENIQIFNLFNEVEGIKVLLNHQLKQSGCELVINQKEQVLLKGDPGKLGQVFTNLIVNAIQAYGANPGKIEIDFEKKGTELLIKVKDYCGGMPKELQAGIFKNILTTKGTEGTGLGLYLCYSIITGHFCGNMSFESQLGEGTTFYIQIPIEEK